jgi:hypothetical protein
LADAFSATLAFVETKKLPDLETQVFQAVSSYRGENTLEPCPSVGDRQMAAALVWSSSESCIPLPRFEANIRRIHLKVATEGGGTSIRLYRGEVRQRVPDAAESCPEDVRRILQFL